MNKQRTFDLTFVGSCVALASLACIAIAWSLIEITQWYLINCPGANRCTITQLVIDYWWFLFVPFCLLAAWALRKLYDKQSKMRSGSN